MIKNFFYGLLMGLLASSLAGCKTTGIDINTVDIQPEIPLAQRPLPLKLHKDIRWYVVTKNNFKRFIKTYERENGTGTFYAISPNDYKKLAINISELKRYIEQQQAVIVYYERLIRKGKK